MEQPRRNASIQRQQVILRILAACCAEYWTKAHTPRILPRYAPTATAKSACPTRTSSTTICSKIPLRDAATANAVTLGRSFLIEHKTFIQENSDWSSTTAQVKSFTDSAQRLIERIHEDTAAFDSLLHEITDFSIDSKPIRHWRRYYLEHVFA